MEDFLGFLGLIAFWIGLAYLGTILRGFFSASKAAVKTAFGEGTFADNFNYEFKGMGALELRGVKKLVGDAHNLEVIELEVRGLFQVGGLLDAVFITSVLDVTDSSQLRPVVSTLHSFQEPHTTCFQFTQEVGILKQGYGFRNWARIGVVPLGLLQPPRRGKRKLRAFVSMVDRRDIPDIANGFLDSDHQDKLYWNGVYTFEFAADQPGWEDEAEGNRTAACVTVKLGIAMAMADGELADEEGDVLKYWIESRIANYEGETRESWRKDLNNALREGYDAVTNGGLVLSDLTRILNESGSQPARYGCIDLLYEVLAVDGVADPEEIALVKKIASALDIDAEELQRIADQKLVGVRAQVESDDDLEQLLGIDQSWDAQQVKRHLRELFQKWNNRMNTLTDQAEKENAQRMLNLIAEARKKYQ